MFSILIVDDEPLIRKGLKLQIPWADAGVTQVMDAASGEQALMMMADMEPDVMITDINMREMTGLELIGRVNAQYPRVDVIVLTGYDDFEYARSCLRMRVKDFLLKPIDEAQLLALVRKLRSDRTGAERFAHEFTLIKQQLMQRRGAEEAAALIDQFEKLAAQCSLDEAQQRHCCFELIAVCQLETPGSEGNLEIAMTVLEQMDCTARMDYVRGFACGRPDEGYGEIIERAKRLIAEQLAEDITVSSLAAQLYITPAYLSRLFKRAVGEGCNEYITRKRIERAKSLLLTTNMKIFEIASMVGYRDNNYFSLTFKKHTGLSPLTYREARRISTTNINPNL